MAPVADEQPNYVGLPLWAQIVIALGGLTLGFLVLLGTWILASGAAENVAMKTEDTEIINAMIGTATNDATVRIRALETYAHIKAISNQQTLGLMAIGAGLALISVGFSLFLIGADGAFKIKATLGKAQDDAIVLYGSAPGLLAFALGAVVVIVGATRAYQLDFHYKNDAPPPRFDPSLIPLDSGTSGDIDQDQYERDRKAATGGG